VHLVSKPTSGSTVGARSLHSAVLGDSGSSPSNQVYILDIRNYTWITTFDALDFNKPNPKTPSSSDIISSKIKLIIGLCVGIFCLICFAIAGFFLYKKYQRRHQIFDTPGSQEID
ncbi:1787_t:CDS:2, partial [Dentiscutata heterogama]